MTLRQDSLWIARAALFGAIFSACSHDDSTTVIQGNPHFNDITTAPAKIQTAARAVVRIHTAGVSGDGFVYIVLGAAANQQSRFGEFRLPG